MSPLDGPVAHCLRGVDLASGLVSLRASAHAGAPSFACDPCPGAVSERGRPDRGGSGRAPPLGAASIISIAASKCALEAADLIGAS